MRKDILNRESEIVSWVQECLPKAEICRRLQCKPNTLKLYLNKMGIEYKGNQGRRGHKTDPKYLTAIEYAKTANPKSHMLKLKLIRDGIRKHQCEKCLNSEWLGVKMPLELHHVDGNHWNNEINNLQLLCPNCHALEPNNSGAGRRHGGVSQLVEEHALEA